jgi:hypothetical protein
MLISLFSIIFHYIVLVKNNSIISSAATATIAIAFDTCCIIFDGLAHTYEPSCCDSKDTCMAV